MKRFQRLPTGGGSHRSLNHETVRSGSSLKSSCRSWEDDISDLSGSSFCRMSLSESVCHSRNSISTSHSKRSLKTASIAPNPRKHNEIDLSINKLNFEGLGLYGRDEELKLLKTCFDNASSGAVGRQLILISGFSGTGKTALADSLREHTNKRKGLYVRGKFDLNASLQNLAGSTRSGARNMRTSMRSSLKVFRYEANSYAAITTACAAICSHILSLQVGRPDMFIRICKRIKEDLGSELSLLIQFVPSVETLMGFDDEELVPNEMQNSSEAAKSRFHFALQRFVRVVSDEFAPLVLVLDDLQWADPSSLDLIAALFSDHKTSNFIVVGTYRSNEVDATHIFFRTLEWFRVKDSEGAFQMTEITIGNLDVAAVEDVIADVLSMDHSDRTMNLAEICHKRTLGNAFFLLHFLYMLDDLKLLQFNLGLMGWTWDLDAIKADTNISDNVVDLLKGKMAQLSPFLMALLKVMACLGSFFEERAVKLALENLSSDLFPKGNCDEVFNQGLATLEKDGYIYNLLTCPAAASRSFSWSHDKIHESATALIESEMDYHAFSFQVGRVLASHMSQSELDTAIFVVVNLLNQATLSTAGDITMNEKERMGLAKLNYQASKKALSFSAFESAAAYAENGINLLPQNHWTDHYELSIGLYSVGAKVTSCLGHVEEMEHYCNEVISLKDTPLEDKLVVYDVLVDHLRNQGKPAEAADLVLDILKRFGCHFPKKRIPVAFRIMGNAIKIKAKAKTLNVDDLGLMMDSTRLELLMLIDRLSTCWFLNDDARLPLATFRTFNWTLKYGYSDFSPISFAQGAMLLTGVMNDLPGGAALGKLALKLAEKSPKPLNNARNTRTKFLVHAFVLPWTVPLVQLHKPLLYVYDEALKCGDPDTSMWSVMIWMLSRLVAGSSLEQLESDFSLYSIQMKDLGRKQQFYISKYVRQVLLNLMGRNHLSLTELIGESCTEEDLAHCKQDKFFAPGLIMYQGILLTYFGDDIRQADAAVRHGHDYHRHSLTIPYDHCLKGVSCYIAAGLTKQKKYSKMADKFRAKIKQWCAMGNPNVKHYEYLLDAERAAFMGEKFEAIKHYEAAILFAARSGIQHDAAFASERFGVFQLNKMKDKMEAKYRLEQSIGYWRDWGAMGKVSNLEKKYGSILFLKSSMSTISLSDELAELPSLSLGVFGSDAEVH